MKRNNILKTVLLLFILFIMIISLTGCSNNENETLKAKTEKELEYLEDNLILIANKLNNITFSTYSLSLKEEKDNSSQGESSNKSDSSQESKSSSAGEDKQGGDATKGESSSQSQESDTHVNYELKRTSILTNTSQKIDWDTIKSDVELLYSTWTSIVIDLHSLNIDNNDILDFGTTLNDFIIAVKNENKIQTLNKISNLYSYIPKYVKQYSDDNEKINLYNIKFLVLNSYNLVEEEKWSEMKQEISKAKEFFTNLINSVNKTTYNQNKLNKTYVLLNELDNSINTKDKDLFYIKYKAFMQNINEL